MDNHIEIEKAHHLLIIHFYGEIDSVMAPVYRGQLSDLIDESEEDVIFDFVISVVTDIYESSILATILYGEPCAVRWNHRYSAC